MPRPELLSLEPRAEGKTVGFVGRLERRKGIETLVRAIPGVLREVPDARFRLVGAPMLRAGTGQRYDGWIGEQLGPLMGAVEIPGKAGLAEMPGVYGEVDICAFPSLWENFPNVCLEAMTAGRAVVGSEAGGRKEILDGGRAGLLAKPGDAELLAWQIIGLLKDPAERIRLGEVARQRVVETYNQKVIGAMTEGVYGEAIELKARARTRRTVGG
jgi:glycosyltransferase involved in cell wall biosynthesis